MGTRRHDTSIRLACAATAIALVTMIGGCSFADTSQSASSGVSTSISPAAPEALVGTDGRSSADVQGYGTPAADAFKDGGTGTAVQTLVVVNKTLRIETADVDASIAEIRALAARDGGDITNMQVSTATDQPIYPMPYDGSVSSGGDSSSVPLRAYVTIRVPSKTYAAFIADAAKLGRVLYQSETADDVTQQHVDMQARLENMKAEQGRLRQLFAKANKVSDMLAIEQELTRVQGEIESMQAQISYLERQAAMATVTIELTEPEPIVSPSGIDWGVNTALTDSVRAFVNTMNGLIVLLGPVLAILLFVGLPVGLIIRAANRASRRRKAAKAAAAASASPEEIPAETPDTEA